MKLGSIGELAGQIVPPGGDLLAAAWRISKPTMCSESTDRFATDGTRWFSIIPIFDSGQFERLPLKYTRIYSQWTREMVNLSCGARGATNRSIRVSESCGAFRVVTSLH